MIKRIGIGIVVIAVVIGLMIGGASAWWDSNFSYMCNTTISNVPSGGYVYNVTLHLSSGTNNATDVFLNNHAQSDYDDVRFILNDTTELSYWLENTTLSTTKAWVKIPNNGTLYIYYGNSTVTSTANGKTTFEFFDGFNDDSINTTVWDYREYKGNITESNGLLDIYVNDSLAHVWVLGKTYFDKPVIMECNLTRPGGLDTNMRRFWGMSNGSTNGEDPISKDHFDFYHWGEDEYVRCAASGLETKISKSFDNDYHNWKLAWKTDEVKFYIDNELNETITSNVTANQTTPFFYGRSGGNKPNSGKHLYVDWVFVRPYKDPEPNLNTFSSENSIPSFNIEIIEGIGVILSSNLTQANIRQFTPDKLNISINSNQSISNYILYIENTDPDLVKAYGDGITQTRYANNTIKLVFDLTASETKYINLTRIWYPTRWSFIVTGDTRPGNDNNYDYVSDQFVEVANEASEVNPIYPILNVGDIVGGGASITSTPVCTEAMHAGYWNVQKNKGIWLGVTGNHDQSRDGNPQGSAQEIFDKYWGSSNYSYAFGNWYFIAINSYADDGSAPSESNANGFISDSQWSWIQDEVNNHKSDYNLISFFHHPLWYNGGCGSWQDSGDCTNLRNLFINSGTKLIMVGHWHYHEETTQSGGLIQLVEGRGGAELSDDETLWGFSVVELNSTDVVEITKVDVTDGNSITTSYNASNDYTNTILKATINNTHSQSIPCMLKFRMSDTNTTAYQVSGADYYDIIKNDYGYVVIAQATAGSSSIKDVIVSTGEENKYNVSGYVKNSEGEAIENAYITNNVTSDSDYTNSDGYYILTNLVNGTYKITATKTGYISNSITITISGADVNNANITLTEAGNLTTLPATNIGKSSVTFNGYSNFTGVVWFEWGLKSGGFMFKTDTIEIDAAGNFSKDIKSPMLYGNKEYKYRAVGIASGTEEVIRANTEEFTMASVPEYENKNFSKYYKELDMENLTAQGLTAGIINVWIDKLGGFFWVILIAIPFLLMFITESNITIPSVIALAAGGALLKYLPEDWRQVAYFLLVVGIAGIMFSIFKSKKR